MATNFTIVTVLLAGCTAGNADPDPDRVVRAENLAQIASGWNAELVGRVDQSYAGWDVEIGDADGDGHPEILTGTAPDSEILQFRRGPRGWESSVLVDHLAGTTMSASSTSTVMANRRSSPVPARRMTRSRSSRSWRPMGVM